MINSTLILIHISGAIIGLLSGYFSMVMRKGSGLHRAAGSVFFVSMLAMSLSAAYLAVVHKPDAMNVTMGLLTFYLVTTGWKAGRRGDGAPGKFELGMMVLAFLNGLAAISIGVMAANGVKAPFIKYPPVMFIVFGSVGVLCALSDVRMFVHGDLSGTPKLARHVWRTTFALLIATGSFFPGQARNLPEWFRETNLVYIPHWFLIASMVFWMIRIRIRKRVRRRLVVAEQAAAGA